jgi:hypothetical protein
MSAVSKVISYNAMPHRIFDDVEEREEGERRRWLFHEATTS